MTILEKLGFSQELVDLFKLKGVFVPRKVVPAKNPLKSPSEEWFASIADNFTPPLDDVEREIFIASPHILGQKIVSGAKLLFELSEVLYQSLERLEASALSDEETVAALFSILRIFHGCLDHNYLKYDRQLEYYEYPEGPVGHFWTKVKQLCSIAAEKAEVPNKEKWINEKILRILSGPRVLTMSVQYSILCAFFHNEFRKQVPDLETSDPVKVVQDLKRQKPSLYGKLILATQHFYKLPEEIVKDSIMSTVADPISKLVEKRERSQETIDNLKAILGDRSLTIELETVVSTFECFIDAQEKEAFVFYGVNYLNRQDKMLGVLDVLVRAFNLIKKKLLENRQFVRSDHLPFIDRIKVIGEFDIPKNLVAARELMCKGERIFINEIEKLCNEELESWFI